MEKPIDQSALLVKWLVGLTASLFFIAGFIKLYQHFFGVQKIERIQLAAKADLDVLLLAQKSFRARYGQYTTDLAGLGIDPKYVYYKFGFTVPMAGGAGQAIPGHDPARMDLDRLKKSKPDLSLYFSEQTGLENIRVAELGHLCAECTATPETFKALAVANLDDDPTLDVWTVDQEGTYEHLVDDVKQ
jgi:hypothetical protein